LALVWVVGPGFNLNSSEDVDELETSPASCSTKSSDGDIARFGTAPISSVSGGEGLTCLVDFAFLDGFGRALVLSQENRSGFFPAVILVDLRLDAILSRCLPRSKFGLVKLDCRQESVKIRLVLRKMERGIENWADRTVGYMALVGPCCAWTS
jgi:hypothetical protein